MKRHSFQRKSGRGYVLQKILDESGDWLARAVPIQEFPIGAPLEARGDTIEEAESRLISKLRKLGSTR